MAKSIWEPRYQQLRNDLKKLRESASLTQVELAERLDKPQSYISKYESGERRLDLVEIEALCRACGTTLSAFVQDFERSHPDNKQSY